MKDIIKLAQELLRRRGLYSGVIDGITGPETLKAVISAIGKKYELTSSPKRTEQYLVMFLQDYALSCGIDPGPVDGWYGQKTAAAVRQIRQNMGEQENDDTDKLLDEADFDKAAAMSGIEKALIKTVTAVESRGRGFLANGEPVILFEGHVFWKHLQQKGINPVDAARRLPEGVLYPSWRSKWYVGGEGEYQRLEAAKKIDEEAALKSASYGLFQLMGFNHKSCGYADVRSFFEDMRRHERHQLIAAMRFLQATRLDKPLKMHDWVKFAKGYNGSGFAKNSYHIKLEKAYKRYAQ
jgi:hypothetical protein